MQLGFVAPASNVNRLKLMAQQPSLNNCFTDLCKDRQVSTAMSTAVAGGGEA